jgi:AcrR family transcriptional regulator
MSDQVLAADGRVIGARAYKTRARLLDATNELLEERGALGLRVVDITRQIGSSPATFYQYFQDVEDAILALAEEATADVSSFAHFFDQPWTAANGMENARRFVDAFVEYRNRNTAILRVRDLKAEEGDQRFRAVRLKGYTGLMAEFTSRIDDAKAHGRMSADLDSYAAAAALMAMMERLVAYQNELGRRGVSGEAIADTIAVLLYQTLTGRKA